MLLKALGVASRPFGTDGEIAFVFPNYLTNILITNLLFVTTAGHLGLAPRDFRFGDLVAIFNGCDTPYVVRLARGAEHGENLFEALQVVGPCYLHGIMNEEIFMDRNAPQFSRLKWTWLGGDTADSLQGWMVLI